MIDSASKTTLALPVVPLITISVRHSSDCPHVGKSQYKRCQCRKSLRYFHNGKQRTVSANTRSWKLTEDAKRKLEDKFRAADPNRPIGDISVKAVTKPTIEKAVELHLSDKLTQGLDPTAYKKHVRELGRLTAFMAKRGDYFPHEIGLGHPDGIPGDLGKSLPLFPHSF